MLWTASKRVLFGGTFWGFNSGNPRVRAIWSECGYKGRGFRSFCGRKKKTELFGACGGFFEEKGSPRDAFARGCVQIVYWGTGRTSLQGPSSVTHQGTSKAEVKGGKGGGAPQARRRRPAAVMTVETARMPKSGTRGGEHRIIGAIA